MFGKRLAKGTFALSIFLCLTSCSALSQAFGEGPFAEARTKKATKGEERLRNSITDAAQEHLGTRYRSAGKSPGGFDCSGFVYYIMGKFDISMASSSSSQENQGKKISKMEAQAGDLVFFRRSKGGRVFHVAMVLENKNGSITLIHSTTSRGVVIDRLNESSYWRSKYMSFRNVVSGS